MYVGGIVGYNSSGTVTNCAFSGTVTGTDDYVGGVVGVNSGNVINCTNTGSVKGSGDRVGGVVGYNSGPVKNCYNTGTVTGPDSGTGNWVGGVVGLNSGIVENCYNTGSVSGNSYVGGVVGDNSSIVEGNSSNVENCYNIGEVSGSLRPVGGVVGNNDGSVTGCYFLQQNGVNENLQGIGSDDSATGATAVNDLSELCGQFKDVPGWSLSENLGRPVLTSNHEGDGTQQHPYRIFTADELENFRDLVNDENGNPAAWAVLMDNIDLKDVCSEDAGESEEEVSWEPIGTSSSNSYRGTFDGNGHTISGLYINDSTANNQGLFGYVSGTVQNLTVSGNVSGGWHVGGVVGYNNGGTVTGCIFSGSGSVSGGLHVGGVVGYNSGPVKNCYNTGKVTGSAGSSYIGGVVGYNQSGSSVTTCYNTGTVSGSDHVGGVVGFNIGIGTVTGCYFLKTDDVNVGRPGIGDGSGDAAEKDDTAFHSGEVAWRLQAGQKAAGEEDPIPQVWGQNIVEDKLPVLTSDSEKTVYQITINLNDSDSTENETRYTNSDLQALTPTREGYTFDGWYESADCSGEAVTTITDTTATLYAKWTPNTYTVTLHTNDGTIAEGEKLTSYTYGVGAKLPTENEITKTGYTFAGWYESANFSGDSVAAIGKDAIGDKAYYANWTANEYDVTLNTDGGTIAEGQNVTSYIYGVGAKLPTENEITKTGYIFAGWYNNADLTGDPVTEISKTDINDKAYWAKWEEVENPDPDPTPTPTPDPEPSGPSTGDSTGWDDIRDELENAEKGEQITIDMGDETKVPAEIFESLAGKDVEISFDLGDIQWSVNGADIPTDTDFTDLDLGVNLDTHGIPVNVINTITGEVGTVQITLAHDGEFGFTMTLTAPLGKENAGYWANLYHYDEDAEALNFEAAAKIDEDGSVAIPFSHASQYAIVIDTHSHATVDVSDLFIDIARDAWYKDVVQYAYDNGLMTGVSATEFAPEQTTTRAMIVSILARLEGVTTAQAAGFADVDDNDWYATAVNWAANVGVVNGYEDNTFKPNTAITREQLAAILMNYAAYKGEDVSNRADLTSYTDQPSTWAEEAMSWAVAEGLITGVTNTELQPQGNATRAQVAAILQRFLSK